VNEPSRKIVQLKADAVAADKMLVTLTAGELREIVRQEIAKAQPKPDKLLYTTAEAAAMLSLKKSWIANAARKGEIEYTRKGHYVLFTKEQIQEIARCSEQ
jgi:excisionase family DNA binding protein